MRAAALSLLTSVALILLSAVSVSADANPANNGHHTGHHYGQLKHHGAPPPPAQAPPPTTNTPPPATTAPRPAASAPAAALNHGVEAITSAMSPVAETRPAMPQTQAVKIVRAVPQRDQLWWLLLVLASTLAVLWLFVSVQLARTAMRRRAGQVSG